MTAAKIHRIFRILNTAGLSLVFEGGTKPKGSSDKTSRGNGATGPDGARKSAR